MRPPDHGTERDRHEPHQEGNHTVNTPPPTSTSRAGLVAQVVRQILIHQTVGVLRAAADRIARCGLFRGEYWPTERPNRVEYIEGDPCCALGALAISAEVDDAWLAEVELARISTQLVRGKGLGEFVVEGAVAPPGDGGVGEVGLA